MQQHISNTCDNPQYLNGKMTVNSFSSVNEKFSRLNGIALCPKMDFLLSYYPEYKPTHL